jgi:hypothetical protein
VARLLAWYRIGSSVAAVASLILANLVPLAGVLWFGWSVRTVLIVYWLENGVVGAFNVLKMLHAEGTDPVRPEVIVAPDGRRFRVAATARSVIPPRFERIAAIPFFIAHYGVFWLVHGIFVLTLPLFAIAAADQALSTDTSPEPGQILVVLVLLAISHGVSYRLNFIGRGEYLRVSPTRQAMAPYGRLVILHVTIIIGGVAIAVTGASVAAIVVLVLLKTTMDLAFHLGEHRKEATEAAGPTPASATEGTS